MNSTNFIPSLKYSIIWFSGSKRVEPTPLSYIYKLIQILFVGFMPQKISKLARIFFLSPIGSFWPLIRYVRLRLERKCCKKEWGRDMATIHFSVHTYFSRGGNQRSSSYFKSFWIVSQTILMSSLSFSSQKTSITWKAVRFWNSINFLKII